MLLHMVSSELSESLHCVYRKYISNVNLHLPTSFLYETTEWQNVP